MQGTREGPHGPGSDSFPAIPSEGASRGHATGTGYIMYDSRVGVERTARVSQAAVGVTHQINQQHAQKWDHL